MKFSMRGQEKNYFLIQVTAIEVTAWAGLTVYSIQVSICTMYILFLWNTNVGQKSCYTFIFVYMFSINI
jgi:hypothetical protein